MSCALISRSPDLKALFDDGFEMAIVDGFLVIYHIPYVTKARLIKFGTLMSPLTLAGDVTAAPSTHVVHFSGEFPCRRDGAPIEALRHGTGRTQLSPNLAADHSFSNKPAEGFRDYAALVRSYVNIISAEATSLEPTVTAQTYRVVTPEADESVFLYVDTATSRAGIGMACRALEQDNIAIVGLGGTGAYVLDLIAKTPIKNIHLYDGDEFLSHNAFRAPGAAAITELKARMKKVAYYAQMYGRMRRNLIEHPVYIDAGNVDELKAMNFVFLCIDDGPARKLIVDALLSANVPFVDTGMGVQQIEHKLIATLRITANTAMRPPGFDPRAAMDFAEQSRDDLYKTNIQIADLNALNAIMAVLRWKKAVGFYLDHECEHHSTYSTNMNLLTSEHCP